MYCIVGSNRTDELVCRLQEHEALFAETSAKDNTNVTEAVVQLARCHPFTNRRPPLFSGQCGPCQCDTDEITDDCQESVIHESIVFLGPAEA